MILNFLGSVMDLGEGVRKHGFVAFARVHA
jgi:hypothetical protein